MKILYLPSEMYRGFLEGIFSLCVENVMHALDPFFFQIKSWYWKTLHT